MSQHSWIKQSAWLTLLFMGGLFFVGLVLTLLWYPISQWLFFDNWQWLSPRDATKWILISTTVGIIPGGILSIAIWYQANTQISEKKRTFIAILCFSGLMIFYTNGLAPLIHKVLNLVFS